MTIFRNSDGSFEGDDGYDKFYQNKYIAVELYTYGGNDDVYLNRADKYGGDNYVSTGSGNDYVLNYFEGGNDIFLGSGNDRYIADIKASVSNDYDVVKGGSGNDYFEVDTEASKYYGEADNDVFLSVGVDNYFNGGSGTDTISYELQDDYSSQRGKGVTIDLGGQSATTTKGHFEDLISIENATGTNYGDDDITGSSGRNILKGLAGDDILDGQGGEDDLYGGSGNDDLYGGSSADILNGGSGTDYLVGGTGADNFDFNNISDSRVGSGKRDVIADFHRSEFDVVDLRGIDANELRDGNQAFKFIGSQSFHERAGELRFSSGVVSGDTDGDGVADFQIKMNGVTKMYSDDFFL